jgi:hypothetical protein
MLNSVVSKHMYGTGKSYVIDAIAQQKKIWVIALRSCVGWKEIILQISDNRIFYSQAETLTNWKESAYVNDILTKLLWINICWWNYRDTNNFSGIWKLLYSLPTAWHM